MLTFKNSGLDKVIAEVGFERLVLETDSPYLSPVPHRGKRNEPSYIRLVAEKLVSLFPESSFNEIEKKTTENASTLFKLELDNGL